MSVVRVALAWAGDALAARGGTPTGSARLPEAVPRATALVRPATAVTRRLPPLPRGDGRRDADHHCCAHGNRKAPIGIRAITVMFGQVSRSVTRLPVRSRRAPSQRGNSRVDASCETAHLGPAKDRRICNTSEPSPALSGFSGRHAPCSALPLIRDVVSSSPSSGATASVLSSWGHRCQKNGSIESRNGLIALRERVRQRAARCTS